MANYATITEAQAAHEERGGYLLVAHTERQSRPGAPRRTVAVYVVTDGDGYDLASLPAAADGWSEVGR